MEAAGFVCCLLALQEEKLGKGRHVSLCAALAPFVLACKDLGRIPKGRKVFFPGELLFNSAARVSSMAF